jgi:hypothetical protein
MKKTLLAVLVAGFSCSPLLASSGTEGASFLDIPVGAGPAALGSAYSALATDAYATTWNPGALGRVDSNQLAGQHLSYLESINYEYLSFVHPLGKGRTLGAAIQYLGSGDIPETNLAGDTIGQFNAHYGAYSLAYGQTINSKLSLGITGKVINAKLAEVGATAYAVDFGSHYQWNRNLSLAAVLTNVGTKLTFLDQADSLPLAMHLGAAYKTKYNVDLAAETVFRQTGLMSFHTGAEWRPAAPIALRIGYRTDTISGLSPLAGLTLGIGLHAWGHEFSYAWLPLGDLGNTQYFSLVLKFGGKTAENRNLIQYQHIKRDRSVKEDNGSDEQELMELLNKDENKSPVAEKSTTPPNKL